MMLAKVGRPVRFLGKKEVFDAPIVGDLARAMGGIRVDRGTGSDAPIRAAEEALEAGDLVAVMPQGTIPRGREFFSPELKGRWGAMKLAHATGVPIIPIGLWGTEKVWPRSSRFPNIANVLSPPTVTVRVGRPVQIGGTDLDADTAAMMEAISALLPAEARRQRDPTPEELARTIPPGASVDDEHETARRPGTD
jgi:putative phosphoserine phosphatase/1-acylglycerol-3-phosphate O-acyltransferase